MSEGVGISDGLFCWILIPISGLKITPAQLPNIIMLHAGKTWLP